MAFHNQLRGLGLFTIVMLCAANAVACPNCKDAIAESGANLSWSINTSVMFMLTLPYVVLGVVCSYFYWTYRSKRLANAIPTGDEVIAKILASGVRVAPLDESPNICMNRPKNVDNAEELVVSTTS